MQEIKEAIRAARLHLQRLERLLDEQVLPAPKAKPEEPPSAEFIRWYDAYPRKTAKPAALRKWREKDLDGQIDKLLTRLEAHKREWKDPAFIPYPATYLNQERYNDPLPKQHNVLSDADLLKQMSR